MTDTHAPPDESELMAVINAINGELKELEAVLQSQPMVPSADRSLGQRRGLDATTYLPVYDAAKTLCDQERYEEALPLAFYLFAHEPHHSTFAFLAASCLHRLGEFAAATELFEWAVDDSATGAVSLFRIGECLEALQHRKEAAQAFDASLDLSRDNPDLHELQDWAIDRSAALNTLSGAAE